MNIIMHNGFFVTNEMIRHNVDIFFAIDNDVKEQDDLSTNIFVDNLNNDFHREKMTSLRIER